jgi:hypothetical protein
MDKQAGELARKLAVIQARLRKDLFDELLTHEEDLESLFDPYSYSPLVHEVREKYLTRIYLIQGIIQQLVYLGHGRNKHATRVLSVAAENQEMLVNQVNRKLVNLNGAKVLDVTFIPGSGKENWSALITYEVNPFIEEADETAAWM